VNVGLLAISQRLLVRGSGGVGVGRSLEVEDMGVDTLGRAERSNDYGSLEGLL